MIKKFDQEIRTRNSIKNFDHWARAVPRPVLGVPRPVSHETGSGSGLILSNIGRENRSKIGPGRGSGTAKIESESARGGSRDALWHPRAFRRCPGSVFARPWHVPEGPGEAPKASRDIKKNVPEGSGACRGAQNRRRVAPRSEKNRFFACGSSVKHCRTGFSLILFDIRFVGKVCEPSKVLRLPAKTRVQPFALRVESCTHCNLERRRK